MLLAAVIRLLTRKRLLLVLAQIAVVAIVLMFVWQTLWEAGGALADYRWNLNPGWLAAAGVLCLIGYLPAGLFWHHLLRVMGQDAGVAETLRAYYIGQLGKYVPGKVMVVVIRAGLIHSHRVDLVVAAVGVFVETLTMMAVGGFLAAAILAAVLRAEWGWLLVGLTFMVLAGLPTFPPVFKRLARLAQLGRRDPDTLEQLDRLGYRTLLAGWVGMTAGWAFTGASLWAVLRSMGMVGWAGLADLPIITALAAVSKVAGFISLIPAGLGVADLTLTGLLANWLARAVDVPSPQLAALVAAVVLRLVWLVSELASSIILYAIGLRWSQAGKSPD